VSLMNRNRSLLCVGLATALALAACSDEASSACPDAPGVICTWAGDGEAAFDGDGYPLLASSFYWPYDITFHAGETYIVDWNNHRIRRVEPDGTLLTVIGTDMVGDGPPDLSDLTPPGALGTTIDLNHPTQLTPLPDGTLALVSWHNHKLRVFDPATERALVMCGRAAGFRGDEGPVADALLDQPHSLAVGPDQSLYILDQRNQVIRRVDPDGIITTVVGQPRTRGFSGDGGSPLEATMAQPTGSNPPPGGWVVFDAAGRLYFSDVDNHRVRRVDFALDLIETVAGDGTQGFSGDGGPATAAALNGPRKLTFGPDGRLYIGDKGNHRVRAVDLTTGVIETVLGTGRATYGGDGGPAHEADLFEPQGVTFDGDHMYILDTGNHRIRRVRL